MIVIIDLTERISRIHPEINQLVARGLIVTDPVDVVVSSDHAVEEHLSR